MLSLYSSKELKKTHSHKGSGTPQAPAFSPYSFLLCHLITWTDQFLVLCPIIFKGCKKNVQHLYGIYHVLGSGTPRGQCHACAAEEQKHLLTIKWLKLEENCLVLKIQMARFWSLEQSQQGSWFLKNQSSRRSCQEKCSCKITDRNFDNELASEKYLSS